MKFKRYKKELIYKEYMHQLTDYELLTCYSPYFISRKLKQHQEQIECMYDLNTSHSTDTALGFTTVSVRLEDLAIYIIEEREKLERYRRKSEANIKLLKQVMSGYSNSQQRSIMKYFISNGSYHPYSIIYQLKKDLYDLSYKARCERNREREKDRLINRYKHTNQLKQAINQQCEVITC